MRAVELPWTKVLGDHSCFGCSQTNAVGLRLTFQFDRGELVSTFTFDHRYESYPGVVHGGIVTTVADEVMGNHLVLKGYGIYFTTMQKTRFFAPIKTFAEYSCRSRIAQTGDDSAVAVKVSADIIRIADGEVVAMSDGTYQKVSAQDAERKMDLPAEVIAEIQSQVTTTQP